MFTLTIQFVSCVYSVGDALTIQYNTIQYNVMLMSSVSSFFTLLYIVARNQRYDTSDHGKGNVIQIMVTKTLLPGNKKFVFTCNELIIYKKVAK